MEDKQLSEKEEVTPKGESITLNVGSHHRIIINKLYGPTCVDNLIIVWDGEDWNVRTINKRLRKELRQYKEKISQYKKAVEKLKKIIKKQADEILQKEGMILEEWKYPLPLLKDIDKIFGRFK